MYVRDRAVQRMFDEALVIHSSSLQKVDLCQLNLIHLGRIAIHRVLAVPLLLLLVGDSRMVLDLVVAIVADILSHVSEHAGIRVKQALLQAFHALDRDEPERTCERS